MKIKKKRKKRKINFFRGERLLVKKTTLIGGRFHFVPPPDPLGVKFKSLPIFDILKGGSECDKRGKKLAKWGRYA